MHEPLTLELVVSVLRDLHAAFPSKMDDKALVRRAEVYRNNLNGISGEALRWAAKQAIQEDNFFPKIARLRDLSTRWTIANVPSVPHSAAHDRQCARCHAPFESLKRWRPARKDKGWGPLEITADGEWLVLEQITRYDCPRCSSLSVYFPELDAPGKLAAMRLTVNDKPNVPFPVWTEARGVRPRAKHIPAPLAPKVPTTEAA